MTDKNDVFDSPWVMGYSCGYDDGKKAVSTDFETQPIGTGEKLAMFQAALERIIRETKPHDKAYQIALGVLSREK